MKNALACTLALLVAACSSAREDAASSADAVVLSSDGCILDVTEADNNRVIKVLRGTDAKPAQKIRLSLAFDPAESYRWQIKSTYLGTPVTSNEPNGSGSDEPSTSNRQYFTWPGDEFPNSTVDLGLYTVELRYETPGGQIKPGHDEFFTLKIEFVQDQDIVDVTQADNDRVVTVPRGADQKLAKKIRLALPFDRANGYRWQIKSTDLGYPITSNLPTGSGSDSDEERASTTQYFTWPGDEGADRTVSTGDFVEELRYVTAGGQTPPGSDGFFTLRIKVVDSCRR